MSENKEISTEVPAQKVADTALVLPNSPIALKARQNEISLLRRDSMKEGLHYGKIPNTQNVTLLKPGADLLLSRFQIAIGIDVEPVETIREDGEVYYRVAVRGIHAPTGTDLGMGYGECSTHEDKYRWVGCSNQQQFNATPEDQRRLKWFGNSQKMQVRQSPGNVSNTILKMAKKRAVNDFCLSVLGAASMFLDPEAEQDAAEEPQGQTYRPARQAPEQPTERPSEPLKANQVQFLRQGMEKYGVSEADFCQHHMIDQVSDLLQTQLEQATAWIRDGQ